MNSKTKHNRSTFLSIAHRRIQPNRSPHTIGTLSMITPSLPLTIKYVICGAHAANQYMKPRNTHDIDILVDDLNKTEAELINLGATKLSNISTSTLIGSSWQLDDMVVDVLSGSFTWIKPAINSSIEGFLSLPYLILMKLISSRSKDLADISLLLSTAPEQSIIQTRKLVSKYLPNDVEDLESLIELSKFE